AQNLDTFFGEVSVEARKSKAGPINGRLANFAMKTDERTLQLDLKLLGVGIIEALHRHDRYALALIAGRSIGSGSFVAHCRPTSNANAERFPIRLCQKERCDRRSTINDHPNGYFDPGSAFATALARARPERGRLRKHRRPARRRSHPGSTSKRVSR